MKKISLVVLLVVLVVTLFYLIPKKNKSLYSVAFYNVENLFDTIHDYGKNDYEYLPNGRKEWTHEKYTHKLKNIARVISELATDKVNEGPIVIGLAEVENFRVLDDLIAEPVLNNTYKYVHQEGPDKRGIDCALLYNPQLFAPTSTLLVESEPYQGDTIHKTRGFLVVGGEVMDEELFFIVNHWPSRGAKAPIRMHAAKQVKAISDSLYTLNKNAKIIIMGDLNDDPMDDSVVKGLEAKKHIKDVQPFGFYNPWWEILEDKGVGTLMYRGEWNLFDQIIVSHSMLNNKGFQYHSAEVFMRDYLFQTTGKYKGAPLRTHGGSEWLNGYSDHLPTIVYLEK